MSRQLFDEAGNAVEVPDEAEINEMKSAKDEVTTIKKEMATLADKSPEGMKSLRAALARKEELVAKLEGELSKKSGLTSEEVTKTATSAAQKLLVDNEVARRVSTLSEEDKTAFMSKFTKLTAGEEVNLETVHVFAEEASRAAGISGLQRSAPLHTGRGPRIDDSEKKNFGDTEAGKEFAKRMGLRIEPPTKK